MSFGRHFRDGGTKTPGRNGSTRDFYRYNMKSEFPDEIEGEAVFDDAEVLSSQWDFISHAEIDAI